MIAGLREAKLSRSRKVKVRFFPRAKMKDFYYYLIPLLQKKLENIIVRFGTNDAPYKNDDKIYKKLKSIKVFINKRHPSCKVYISAQILRLDSKNANSILQKYVDKSKVAEEKSVILHDNILSSHLNKDGLHLNSSGTIKLTENFISRIRMFWCNEGSYKEFKCFNSGPTLETSNSVSFDSVGIDKNSPEFLLKHLRFNHTKNIIIVYLNINSIRNKFDLLKKIVAEEIDILMITETKLHDSFPASQILIQGFCTPFRLDRNKNGGGILLYIRSNMTSPKLNKYIIKNQTEASGDKN